MKVVAKVLKTALLIIMGVAAALLAAATVPAIFNMPRVSVSLLVVAIGVTSSAVLWIEFRAFAKWVADYKAAEKREKVLSAKGLLLLTLLLAIYEAAVAALLGAVLSVGAKTAAFMMLLPTIETPFAIPLWLAVAVIVKQLSARQ